MKHRAQCLILGLVFSAGLASAAPVTSPWPVAGGDDTVAVAAAALSGWYATGDSFEDSVEIRHVDPDVLVRSISRAEIEALVPWLSLGGGPDGPSGLAWSDSGRSLFILIHDDTSPGLGEPSDAVLRYDTFDDTLSVFAELDLFNSGATWPRLSAVHHRGRLYVGSAVGDVLRVYRAERNDTQGVLLESHTLPGTTILHGLAVDRGNGAAGDRARYLYAAGESTLFRAVLDDSAPLTFIEVGALSGIQAITYSDHFPGPTSAGLYALDTSFQILHIPQAQARGEEPLAPILYHSGSAFDLAATADGALLAGASEDALLIRDDTDPHLSFDEWIADELAQAILFVKALISPDGEPSGWVIDADVDPSFGSRFHPATPDAAAWAILALLVSDRLGGDAEAQGLVRQILQRYAGQAIDGIAPTRSVDGIFEHWIDPETGNTAPGGWPAELATFSTMLIATAASRARAFYPDDPVIRAAGEAIVCGVSAWDTYLTAPPDCGLYRLGLSAGGPAPGSLSTSFNEGILFVALAAAIGDARGAACFELWLDRDLWPSSVLVNGKPVTGDLEGQFLPAFASHYPFLTVQRFREDPDWQQHLENLLCSSSAWTDDQSPLYLTVFSAGTAKPKWSEGSGFHADNLLDHPGNISTFPALLAFTSTGKTPTAVAAYHAFRKDARQSFLGIPGAAPSLLYRRADEDPLYTPNSAGIPDVVYGALALAALLEPAAIEEIFTAEDPGCPIFADGFESGSPDAWSVAVPAN